MKILSFCEDIQKNPYFSIFSAYDVIKILSRDTPVLVSNDLKDEDEHSCQIS